jgi:acyl-coenzyme A thioesterase PaaI-like protein
MSSVWKRLSSVVGNKRLLKLIRLYPPFLGAGVRVTYVSDDLRAVNVEMPLTSYNRNFVGTQFGGSLYAMCDPFFMLMVMMNLGPEYVVWDKSASIRFVKPGRGRVHACFELSGQRLAAIRDEVDRDGRSEPEFRVEVKDDQGEVIARVQKVLHIQPKAAAVRAEAEPAKAAST